MKLVSFLILFGSIVYLYGFLTAGASDEFKGVVLLTLAICSLAGITTVGTVAFMSLFGADLSPKDDESDDDSDDEEDESTEEEPPKCEGCGNSDRWMFTGQSGFDFSGKRVALDHACLCGSWTNGFIADKNRSSYLKMTPTFFDLPDNPWLEERYDEIKDVILFQEQPYYCDHPGCSSPVNVIGCLFPDIHISLYLDGSCAMVQSKDDEQKLIKKDFCEDHKADGQHTFVVCNWDRVGVEPVQRISPPDESGEVPVQPDFHQEGQDAPLEDTENSGDENGTGNNGSNNNASGDNQSGDNNDKDGEAELNI